MVYGYGQDDDQLQVWLDAWTAENRPRPSGARGAVCQRHGSLLTAPRGWVLVDRREDIPRLFMPRPVLVHSRPVDSSESLSRTADSSGAQRRRRIADLPTPQLFVESRAALDIEIDDAGDVRTSDEVGVPAPCAESFSSSRHDRNETHIEEQDEDDNESLLLDATGPLLKRAFSKRNTGRNDPSQELMRPTHRAVDESA